MVHSFLSSPVPAVNDPDKPDSGDPDKPDSGDPDEPVTGVLEDLKLSSDSFDPSRDLNGLLAGRFAPDIAYVAVILFGDAYDGGPCFWL